MNRKTLIINGSPRINGDTSALIKELKKHLQGEIIELSAFRSSISPCLDCRQCQKTGYCLIHDDMEIIYHDDFDNVVLAAPVYYRTLPGPVLSLISRFQAQRAAKFILNRPVITRPKKAGLILTAGGKGNEGGAEHHIRVLFKMLNAHGFEDHYAASVNTDMLPAAEDEKALAQCAALAEWLNKE